jgi:hypothetical protein
METRNAVLTIESAKKMFESGDENLRQLALDTFPELRGLQKWEELDRISGYYVNSDSEIYEISGKPTKYVVHSNIFAEENQAEGFGLAAPRLTQVVKRARRGWKPKFDGSQDNWVVVLYDGILRIENYRYIPYPFAMPTKELAEQLLKECREDLENFWVAMGS